MTYSMAHLVGKRYFVGCRCILRCRYLLLTTVNLSTQAARGVVVEEVIAGQCSLHDIRCEEGGYHTGCHDNGIDDRVKDAQAGAQ